MFPCFPECYERIVPRDANDSSLFCIPLYLRKDCRYEKKTETLFSFRKGCETYIPEYCLNVSGITNKTDVAKDMFFSKKLFERTKRDECLSCELYEICMQLLF